MEDIPEDIWLLADKALTPDIFYPHMEIQSATRNMRAAIAKAVKEDRDGRWQDINLLPSHCEALVCVSYRYSDDDEWTTDMWVDTWLPRYGWLVWPKRPDLPEEPTHWMELPLPPKGSYE